MGLRSGRTSEHKYTESTKARRLAREAHGDQQRRGGEPYMLHVARVAHSVERYGWETQTVAWLHDTIEDTPVTPEVLLEVHGFDPEVVADVMALTRPTGYPYREYIRELANRPRAAVVKFYDILDNLGDDPSTGREAHYREALAYLSQVIPKGEMRP